MIQKYSVFLCCWAIHAIITANTVQLTRAIHQALYSSCTHTPGLQINFVLVLSFVPSVLWRCWLGGRKGIRPVKTEWWGAGMVICLQRGADLHMAQLMPLPLTVSCFNKSQIGFTFCYHSTLVVMDKGPLNGGVVFSTSKRSISLQRRWLGGKGYTVKQCTKRLLKVQQCTQFNLGCCSWTHCKLNVMECFVHNATVPRYDRYTW